MSRFQMIRVLARSGLPTAIQCKFRPPVMLAPRRHYGALSELERDSIDPAWFYRKLQEYDIDYYCGVPDSLLKDFCAYVSDHVPADRHVITANEGSAIGMAAGYHLATHRTPLVYLQNSGLGNAVNPLLSMAARDVYSIPILLLIGWRGEPGRKDEPQHLLQGRSTIGMLEAMRIRVEVLPDYEEGAAEALEKASVYMQKKRGPYCLLVKRFTFSPYELQTADSHTQTLPTREESLQWIIAWSEPQDVFIGTTGMLSRELYEIRASRQEGHHRDFLTVGSMGHASAIALGVAQQLPRKQVFCLDGDGSIIMHMGTMATVGQVGLKNFKHVILNNGVHDSVGGQQTAASSDALNLPAVASACGYTHVASVREGDAIPAAMSALRVARGPALLEILVKPGSRNNLGRPKTSTYENKNHFMEFLADK